MRINGAATLCPAGALTGVGATTAAAAATTGHGDTDQNLLGIERVMNTKLLREQSQTRSRARMTHANAARRDARARADGESAHARLGRVHVT